MSDISCPECGLEHSISDMEMWEVYDEDGKETEFNCHCCDKPLVVTSIIIGWSFEVEVSE